MSHKLPPVSYRSVDVPNQRHGAAEISFRNLLQSYLFLLFPTTTFNLPFLTGKTFQGMRKLDSAIL